MPDQSLIDADLHPVSRHRDSLLAVSGTYWVRSPRTAVAFLLIGAFLLAYATAAVAQRPNKVPRIGLLWVDSKDSSRLHEFYKGLRDLGYVQGQNIIIEYRDAGGKADRLPELAAELIRLKVDVIVSDGGPAIEALRNSTRTIPIVMPAVTGPIGRGFVASLERPGGNVTGLTNLGAELSGKRLELLKEAVPRITSIAVFWNEGGGQQESARKLEEAARALEVEATLISARGPNGLERAFDTAIRTHANALMTVPHPRLRDERTRIAEFAVKNRLPAIFPARYYAEAGGLMAYGPDFSYTFRRAAVYVDKILKGTKVQDLPVENPMKFELIINLKTAKAIGVNIPPRVLMWADKVIK